MSSKPPVKEPVSPMGATQGAGGSPEASPPQTKPQPHRRKVEDPMEPSAIAYLIPKENKVVLYAPSTNVVTVIQFYERITIALNAFNEFELYIRGDIFKNIIGVFVVEDSNSLLRMLLGKLRRIAKEGKAKEGKEGGKQ